MPARRQQVRQAQFRRVGADDRDMTWISGSGHCARPRRPCNSTKSLTGRRTRFCRPVEEKALSIVRAQAYEESQPSLSLRRHDTARRFAAGRRFAIVGGRVAVALAGSRSARGAAVRAQTATAIRSTPAAAEAARPIAARRRDRRRGTANGRRPRACAWQTTCSTSAGVPRAVDHDQAASRLLCAEWTATRSKDGSSRFFRAR